MQPPAFNPAPTCQHCQRPYLEGRKGLCSACLRRQRKRKHVPKRNHSLLCDCGKKAVTVIEVRVGEGGVYRVRLPLCQECLDIELEMKE